MLKVVVRIVIIIYWGILGKLPMVLDIDEKKSNSRKFDKIEKRLACKNTFIDTLVVQVIGDSLTLTSIGISDIKLAGRWGRGGRGLGGGRKVSSSINSEPVKP